MRACLVTPPTCRSRRLQLAPPWRERLGLPATMLAHTVRAAAPLVAAWLVGCQDPTTVVASRTAPTAPGVVAGPRWDAAPSYADSSGVTHYGPVQIPVGNPVRPDGSARLGVFPTDRYTLLYVSISGQNAMSATSTDVYPSGFVSGATGIASAPYYTSCNWGASVYSDSGGRGLGGFPYTCGRSGATGPLKVYGYAVGVVFGHQDGDAGWACGTDRRSPCYTASGGFTMEAWVPRAQMSLDVTRNQTDTTAVKANDDFTFNVTITPDQFEGTGVPRYVERWQYVEDGTGNTSVVCGTATSCRYFPAQSGVMRVTVWVNTYVQTTTYPVRLGPIGLSLTASRTSVAPGDTVTFTPVPAPAGAPVQVTSWSWQPDSGAAQTVCGTNAPCTTAIAQSGTMILTAKVQGTVRTARARVTTAPPRVRVTASRSNVKADDSVTFKATAVSGSAAQLTVQGWTFRDTAGGTIVACGAGQTTCQWRVPRSGWMKAQCTISGVPTSDSAFVYVVPCPVGDTLVDRKAVRDAFATTWPQSKDGDPNPDNHLERPSIIYRDNVGAERYFAAPPGSGDTPCRSVFQPPPGTPDSAIVALIHTHPFSVGDLLGAKCGSTPWRKVAYGIGYGGPSGADWAQAYDTGKPMVVIDRDSVYIARPYAYTLQVTPNSGGKKEPVPNPGWQNALRVYPRRQPTCQVF